MPNTAREKFSSQAAPEVLTALRKIAESEGRPIQAVLDEALREYIERKEKRHARHQVIDAFAQSLSEFDQLYRELAK
jgi:predicted transcriptional regulator